MAAGNSRRIKTTHLLWTRWSAQSPGRGPCGGAGWRLRTPLAARSLPAKPPRWGCRTPGVRVHDGMACWRKSNAAKAPNMGLGCSCKEAPVTWKIRLTWSSSCDACEAHGHSRLARVEAAGVQVAHMARSFRTFIPGNRGRAMAISAKMQPTDLHGVQEEEGMSRARWPLDITLASRCLTYMDAYTPTKCPQPLCRPCCPAAARGRGTRWSPPAGNRMQALTCDRHSTTHAGLTQRPCVTDCRGTGA